MVARLPGAVVDHHDRRDGPSSSRSARAPRSMPGSPCLRALARRRSSATMKHAAASQPGAELLVGYVQHRSAPARRPASLGRPAGPGPRRGVGGRTPWAQGLCESAWIAPPSRRTESSSWSRTGHPASSPTCRRLSSTPIADQRPPGTARQGPVQPASQPWQCSTILVRERFTSACCQRTSTRRCATSTASPPRSAGAPAPRRRRPGRRAPPRSAAARRGSLGACLDAATSPAAPGRRVPWASACTPCPPSREDLEAVVADGRGQRFPIPLGSRGDLHGGRRGRRRPGGRPTSDGRGPTPAPPARHGRPGYRAERQRDRPASPRRS